LAYAGYILIFELSFFFFATSYEITKNEYTEGPLPKRIVFVFKDLVLSQLSKFDLYADVCFIVLVISCQVDLAIAWISIGILGLNILIEIFYVLK
jgi:hypothetical protein